MALQDTAPSRGSRCTRRLRRRVSVIGIAAITLGLSVVGASASASTTNVAALPTLTLSQGQGCFTINITLTGGVPSDLTEYVGLLYGDPQNPYATVNVHVGPGIVPGQAYTVSIPLSTLDPAGYVGNYPAIFAQGGYFYDGVLGGDRIELDRSCVPPVVTVIDIPAQPGVTDPSGADNATWNVPANTDTLSWSVGSDGHLIVTVTADNTTFPGGDTTHDYGIAPDSGVVDPPPTTTETTPTVSTTESTPPTTTETTPTVSTTESTPPTTSTETTPPTTSTVHILTEDVYPTDSHNGEAGKRFPVPPFVAVLVFLAAAIFAVRRWGFAAK